MPDKTKMPLAGEFTSKAGFPVRVRCATVSQVVALASADGSAAIMKATAAVIDGCAEIDGLAPGEKPSDFLTVADGQHVVRLAQGGGEADFT